MTHIATQRLLLTLARVVNQLSGTASTESWATTRVPCQALVRTAPLP